MEDRERERLHRQAAAGDRARVVLEEIEAHRRRQEEALATRLVGATTPEAAFEVACDLRALRRFVSEAQAAVSYGDAAKKSLLEDECNG